MRVTRLRASPRHGGSRWFFIFLVSDLLPAHPKCDNPQRVDRNSHMKQENKKWGSRGCSPWAASPSGGERGSPSYLPQNINKKQTTAGFLQHTKKVRNPEKFPKNRLSILFHPISPESGDRHESQGNKREGGFKRCPGCRLIRREKLNFCRCKIPAVGP